jgi:hypothetical protein|tara:strand:- start:165 stop:356 length:192 start_codon:yes stop_codon:yes gene_type:complete
MYLAQPVIVGIPGVLPKGRNYDPVHPDEQRVIESFGITAPPGEEVTALVPLCAVGWCKVAVIL